MPPPGHEPFLLAICENPADDAPRLIYADWLDEIGDTARAEFIRLQIGLVHGYDAEEALAARFRCEELFRANYQRWVSELPGNILLWSESVPSGQLGNLGAAVEEAEPQITWIEGQPSLDHWERGFPAVVFVRANEYLFLSCVRQIEEFVPVHRLRLMQLNAADRFITTLAKTSFLEKIRELIIPEELRDATVIALANSPHVSQLRQLSLVSELLSDNAGMAFVTSPFLHQLEMLHLLRNHFSELVRTALRARFGFRVYC
jgi:uncharacterized protein (TIGR02996 family)